MNLFLLHYIADEFEDSKELNDYIQLRKYALVKTLPWKDSVDLYLGFLDTPDVSERFSNNNVTEYGLKRCGLTLYDGFFVNKFMKTQLRYYDLMQVQAEDLRKHLLDHNCMHEKFKDSVQEGSIYAAQQYLAAQDGSGTILPPPRRFKKQEIDEDDFVWQEIENKAWDWFKLQMEQHRSLPLWSNNNVIDEWLNQKEQQVESDFDEFTFLSTHCILSFPRLLSIDDLPTENNIEDLIDIKHLRVALDKLFPYFYKEKMGQLRRMNVLAQEFEVEFMEAPLYQLWTPVQNQTYIHALEENEMVPIDSIWLGPNDFERYEVLEKMSYKRRTALLALQALQEEQIMHQWCAVDWCKFCSQVYYAWVGKIDTYMMSRQSIQEASKGVTDLLKYLPFLPRHDLPTENPTGLPVYLVPQEAVRKHVADRMIKRLEKIITYFEEKLEERANFVPV